MAYTQAPETFYYRRSGVDLTETGNKLSLPVPTGRVLIIDSLILRVTTVTNYSGAPSVRAGITPNFDEFLAELALTNLNSVGEFVDLAMQGGMVKTAFSGGQSLVLDCSVASASDVLTVEVEVVGHIR